jgi:predicted metal-dependent hydrolase
MRSFPSCWMARTSVNDRQVELRRRVERWARCLAVEPRTVRIQRMMHKWGSCSSKGTISLAEDLADRSPEFQNFVIVHELLHMRIPNHGRLFRAVMSVHVPNWRSLSLSRRC